MASVSTDNLLGCTSYSLHFTSKHCTTDLQLLPKQVILSESIALPVVLAASLPWHCCSRFDWHGCSRTAKHRYYSDCEGSQCHAWVGNMYCCHWEFPLLFQFPCYTEPSLHLLTNWQCWGPEADRHPKTYHIHSLIPALSEVHGPWWDMAFSVPE